MKHHETAPNYPSILLGSRQTLCLFPSFSMMGVLNCFSFSVRREGYTPASKQAVIKNPCVISLYWLVKNRYPYDCLLPIYLWSFASQKKNSTNGGVSLITAQLPAFCFLCRNLPLAWAFQILGCINMQDPEKRSKFQKPKSMNNQI